MNEQDMLTQIYKIFHPSLPRLGPGDEASTIRALEMLPPFLKEPTRSIIDLGCGNGAQTLCLAQNLAGHIRAVDTHQPFLDELLRRAEIRGCRERIHAVCADMGRILPDQDGYDLVWSEGAMYNLGLETGLGHCRRLLREDAYLAFTDLCWLGSDRPQDCLDFFAMENLTVLDIPGNIKTIEQLGFRLIGHFALPADSWRREYYLPLSRRLKELRASHAEDEGLMKVVGMVEFEIDVFRRYEDCYGYVFFVLKS